MNYDLDKWFCYLWFFHLLLQCVRTKKITKILQGTQKKGSSKSYLAIPVAKNWLALVLFCFFVFMGPRSLCCLAGSLTENRGAWGGWSYKIYAYLHDKLGLKKFLRHPLAQRTIWNFFVSNYHENQNLKSSWHKSTIIRI